MPKPTLNAYTCELCGFSIVTVDHAAGVTPAFIPCQVTPDCPGWMHSARYRVAQDLPPTHEWYRPDPAEIATLSPARQEHVRLGGLLLRPLPEGERHAHDR